jgi:hypothetical protein
VSERSRRLRLPCRIALLCVVAVATGNLSTAKAQDQDKNTLLILNDSELSETYPRTNYFILFRARGGTSDLHWHLEKGTLPPGLKLEDAGQLHGQPQRAGEYHFTISVTDSGTRQAVQKEFVLRVVEAITVNWKAPARVNGNRIEGSVLVSNTTSDDVDLTFIVEAVAENGRATAIGYQHFPLAHATKDMELPFGESLPSGAYLVNVDVVAEVASRNQIYRQRLQMPQRLRVTVGP